MSDGAGGGVGDGDGDAADGVGFRGLAVAVGGPAFMVAFPTAAGVKVAAGSGVERGAAGRVGGCGFTWEGICGTEGAAEGATKDEGTGGALSTGALPLDFFGPGNLSRTGHVQSKGLK